MRLYLSVIFAAITIISVINIVLTTALWYNVVLLVILCTASQFAIDGLIALIINKLPDRFFAVNNPLYDVTMLEKRIYTRLRVRKWKDYVWELGSLGGFSKKRLVHPNNPKYIEKFIIECNKGVLTHRLSYLTGILPMLVLRGIFVYTIALPVAAVNLLLNILPTLALRYNTPMLKRTLKRLLKERAASSNSHS